VAARIWGGLHYRFSVEAGLRLAERVVAHNLARNFRLDGGGRTAAEPSASG
jgi:hypothetical protein